MSRRKRFRFEIDLRQGQPLPEVAAEDAFSPSDSIEAFSPPLPEQTSAAPLQDASPPPPSSPQPNDFEPLPPETPKPSAQTVQAYQQLLAYLQDLPCAHRHSDGQESRTNMDRDRKRSLRRPLENCDDTIEEYLLLPCGSISRKVYERVCGPSQDLGALFIEGLDSLGQDLERFRAFPGYELRAQLYFAEGHVLRHSRLQLYGFDGQKIRKTVL